MKIWKTVTDFFDRRLWAIDLKALGRPSVFLIKSLRLTCVGLREFTEGQIVLRAAGLVYPTLLAFVPLLAVSFSVLKSFGAYNILRPALLMFLTPLGPEGREITKNVFEYIESLRVGVLGSVGLALLIYTVASLLKKAEDAFVYIWKIRKPRRLLRRFSDYMSVLLVGPVLLFAAFGLTTAVMSTAVVREIRSLEPFGTAIFIAGKVAPYVLVCMAFTLIYIVVPNTKVKFRSALMGGVFAGVLWETSGWAFAAFFVSSVKYPSIYSGFAVLMLFIMWIYLSWLILLAGAQVSFYHQYPHFLIVKKEAFLLSNRLKEKLAFLIMFIIADNYHRGLPHWRLDALIDRLELPVEPVLDVLTLLEKRGLILESSDEPPSFFPSRDIETITLGEVLSSTRAAEEEHYSIDERFLTVPEVDGVITALDDAASSALRDMTVKDLVLMASRRTAT